MAVYFDVSQHVFQVMAFFQILMKEFWALVELMVPYGDAIYFEDIEEVIHDVAFTD